MKEHSRDSFKSRLSETSVAAWSKEGTNLADKVAYDSIKPGDTPSEEYIERGFDVIREQLAIGGYRLTDLLTKLESDLDTVKIVQK